MTTNFLSKYIKGATSFSGQLVRGTTPADQSAFRIPDATIKQLIGKGFGGRQPNDIFFKDPTSWGNKFAEYGWTPLTTTLRPVSFTLLGQNQKSTVLVTDSFTNNSPTVSTWNVSLTKQVENTNSSTWSKENSFGVDVSATAGINIEIFEASTTISTSFSHTWGQSQTTSETTTIGTTSGFSVEVQPGQTRSAILKATLGTYTLRVDYDAVLSGGVFANYNPTANGHHFWYIPIGNILYDGNLTNRVRTSQNIETNKYFDGQIIVN